ncbi:hypothetical protein CDL15_Pgr004934 [Punica granatum]|uniref:Uncharacterized protein n=1 Tax=Punica granatum TaxID=22663 RepID=A0A218WXF7_PUNGR|nr:hypothetical protein CDL15_Pgr004934 [Punica granatum]
MPSCYASPFAPTTLSTRSRAPIARRIDALVIQGLRDDVRKFSDKIQSLEKEVEEKVKEKRAMKQSLDQADSLVVKA